MKKAVCLLLIVLLISTNIKALACTSFAAYTKDDVFYGMNFDYPDSELLLRVTTYKDTKVFSLSFKYNSGTSEVFSPVAIFNSKGVFINSQMQYPQSAGKSRAAIGECFFNQVDDLLNHADSVEIIKEFLKTKRVVQYPNITLHKLVADKTGKAIIIESGDKSNEILEMEDRFMVMTNFKNSDFKDYVYKDIQGAGADRYITAYKYLTERIDTLTLTDSIEILKKTRQFTSYPTLCSMVFCPGKNEIYLSFKDDFEKIWKVNLEESTIETYGGFKDKATLKIDSKGISYEELKNAKSETNKLNQSLKTISVSIVVLCFFTISLLISRIKNKRMLIIIWSVVALVSTFLVAVFLKTSYPVFTFIWISVSLALALKNRYTEKIQLNAMKAKTFFKYSIINLFIVCAVILIFEPWSGTYKMLIDIVTSDLENPDSTFAWLSRVANPAGLIGMYIYSFFVTMFGEEIFFRGFLLRFFKGKVGDVWAIIVQAFIFGLLCGSIMFLFLPVKQALIFTAVYAMTIGMAGGWTALKTQSILPSLFAAATSNLIVVAILVS